MAFGSVRATLVQIAMRNVSALAARYRSASAACGVRSELGLALAGFALGYGTREVVSYRRRQAARERYRQLGLVD